MLVSLCLPKVRMIGNLKAHCQVTSPKLHEEGISTFISTSEVLLGEIKISPHYQLISSNNPLSAL